MSRSFSVLMFCPQFRPAVGGAERQAEKLAVALAAAGCRVTILTPRLDVQSPDIEEVEGVRIERFASTDLAQRWPVSGISLLNIPFILWQVFRMVRRRLKDADVLHAHTASLQVLGALLAARSAHVPVLCKAAMADSRSDLGEMEKQGPSGRFLAQVTRRMTPCWVATTDAVRDALTRAGVSRSRITCIPNGVDLPTVGNTALPAAPARRFLYLGRLSVNSDRDTPTLIDAFERLAQSYPDIELALVGGGDRLTETQAKAKSCSASARIHVPGFDDPGKWLSWSDCFVLPSRKEGLSNALLEAMAAGLPCIANDIPPNREALAGGAAGVLVPVGDEDALYGAMKVMATNADHAVGFAAASYDRVCREYEINAVAAHYMNLYDQLTTVSRRTGPLEGVR